MSRQPPVTSPSITARNGKNSEDAVAPGVDQDRTGPAKQQEHERRLIVDRHVLPQNHGVLVAPVDLNIRVSVVL
jgi:hypothetical protein